MAYPVEVYSSGVLVSSGTLSEEQELEQGGCDSMFVYSGGTAVETTINEGTVLTADSGAVIECINIEGGVLSATDAYCSGAEKWYGPVACATTGDIVLSGGTYTANAATDLNGAIGFGGAFQLLPGMLTVNGGVYSSNSATGGGGAIYVAGTASITDAEFTGNSALS